MALKKIENININFPQDSGFSKSKINFYSGTINLEELYFNKDQINKQRLFVTDSNIFNLKSIQNFTSNFKIKINENVSKNNDSENYLLVLPAGEKFKNIESVLEIVKTALNQNFNRNCIFIAIGGGVISDMTAFAASIFKRGVDVEFIPTSLLANVDAALGGKTGCDFDSYKNMIGSFYPAKELHIWPEFIQSLSEKEYYSGLAEAIKTALLFSESMTEIFSTQEKLIQTRNEKILEKIIIECAKAKAKIVEEDFKEKSKRALLNLGHSFGHALESVWGLGKITHGEAVAWGISRAYELSFKKNYITEEIYNNVVNLLKKYNYITEKIPKELQNDKEIKSKLIDAMKKDKKNNSSKIRLVLPEIENKFVITEIADEEIQGVL